MSKINPMLKALDGKIVALKQQRTELDGQLAVLEATRAELSGLVRKRRRATPAVVANENVA